MQLKYNGATGENFVNILNKMAAISQTTPCCIRIHFTLGQHWLVYWSGLIWRETIMLTSDGIFYRSNIMRRLATMSWAAEFRRSDSHWSQWGLSSWKYPVPTAEKRFLLERMSARVWNLHRECTQVDRLISHASPDISLLPHTRSLGYA